MTYTKIETLRVHRVPESGLYGCSEPGGKNRYM